MATFLRPGMRRLMPIWCEWVATERVIPASLTFLVALLMSSHLYAQASRVNRYIVTTFSGTYTSINTGSSMGSGDDRVYACPQTLPFKFNYDSIVYNTGQTIYVNT